MLDLVGNPEDRFHVSWLISYKVWFAGALKYTGMLTSYVFAVIYSVTEFCLISVIYPVSRTQG